MKYPVACQQQRQHGPQKCNDPNRRAELSRVCECGNFDLGADLAGGVHTELVQGVIDGCFLLGLGCPAIQVDSNVLKHRLTMPFTCKVHSSSASSA